MGLICLGYGSGEALLQNSPFTFFYSFFFFFFFIAFAIDIKKEWRMGGRPGLGSKGEWIQIVQGFLVIGLLLLCAGDSYDGVLWRLSLALGVVIQNDIFSLEAGWFRK